MSNYNYISNTSLYNVTPIDYTGSYSYQYKTYASPTYRSIDDVMNDIFCAYGEGEVTRYLLKDKNLVYRLYREISLLRANDLAMRESKMIFVFVDDDRKLAKNLKHAYQIATANFPQKSIAIQEVDVVTLKNISHFYYNKPEICKICSRSFEEGSFDGGMFLLRRPGEKKIKAAVVCQICYEKES